MANTKRNGLSTSKAKGQDARAKGYTAWDNLPNLTCNKPWAGAGLTTAQVFALLAKEAKACMYEMLRAHVEFYYKATGWPSDPKAWHLLESERNETVGLGDLPTGSVYGITYGAARQGDDGPYAGNPIPVASLHLNGEPPLALLWHRWKMNFLGTRAGAGEVHGLLRKLNYAKGLKEEMSTAFMDFEQFEIGQGAGKKFMESLRGEEPGRLAITLTEKRIDELSNEIKDLLKEPFGIERDFIHLDHALHWALSTALMKEDSPWAESAIMRDHWFKQPDTRNVLPHSTSIGVYDGDRGGTINLTQWTSNYLERVAFIATRWRNLNEPNVDARLTTLREQALTMDLSWWEERSTPDRRTEVEAAQQKVIEGIEGIVEATATTKQKPAKARPEIPSLASKFAKDPGSLDKWMGLLRSEGVVNAAGQFAMAEGAKGKGKLIAAWTAAFELFQLDGYGTDTELLKALKDHIHGLTGLDRLDKVRKNQGFSDLVTKYKEDLEVD